MAAKDTVTLWIWFRSKADPSNWFVHPDLARRIAAEAAEKETNASDIAQEILSRHFKVPYEPRRRKGEWDASKGYINFGVAPELDAAIRVGAASSGRKPMDLCRLVLCAHYGLGVPAKKKLTRAPRRPRAAAA